MLFSHYFAGLINSNEISPHPSESKAQASYNMFKLKKCAILVRGVGLKFFREGLHNGEEIVAGADLEGLRVTVEATIETPSASSIALSAPLKVLPLT